MTRPCQLLSGGLSLSLEEGSTAATEEGSIEVALPSNADLQIQPGNSVVASLWTIECIRTGKELTDRTEHELRKLDEQRSQRRVSARNNARKLRADRDREIRSAQLSLESISEQKMVQSVRTVTTLHGKLSDCDTLVNFVRSADTSCGGGGVVPQGKCGSGGGVPPTQHGAATR